MKRNENWHPFWDAKLGTWAVDFRVEGRRIRRRLPISDRTLKDVAIEAARRMHREAWRKALKTPRKTEPPTFFEGARLYIAAGGESRFLPKLTRYFGPKIRVDEIDALAIARAGEDLYPDAKAETVRRQLRVPIRAVQNFAAGRRREKLSDTRRVRWLSPEEAERLLIAASRPENCNLRDPSLR